MTLRIPGLPFMAALLLYSLLTGCGNDSHSNSGINTSADGEKLRPVGDAAALEAYIKNGLKGAVASGGIIATAAFSGDTRGGDDAGAGLDGMAFSTTTLIESGVDEADTVKTDGDRLFVAVPVYGDDCIELCEWAGIAAGEPHGRQNHIRVMRIDDAAHAATELGRVNIPQAGSHDSQRLDGLLLRETDNGEDLIAITVASSNHAYNGNDIVPVDWSAIWAWASGSTIVDRFDVTDSSTITHRRRMEIDGFLLQTRRIGDTLYVVTRFTPEVAASGSREQINAHIDALPLAQLLPQITIDGNAMPLIDPDNCFIDTSAAGYPTLMVVTAIALNDNSHRSSCVTANVYGFYMSSKSLYLNQAEWSGDDVEMTHIYKFSLTANGPQYRGEGRVNGTPTANYNFVISEYNDVLRIVTTRTDAGLAPVNELHTLGETEDGNLQTLATLPNAQYPQPLGKPGEAIHGIRFAGDRAYVVTFRQTDPLYVLDLADPANPRIAGQVELPGFSTLLQPLGNDLLLGVGRASGNDLKIELYDVSNPAMPQSAGKYVMDSVGNNAYSQSPAIWDHRALALMTHDNKVHVAMPYYRYSHEPVPDASHGALSFWVDLSERSLHLLANAGVPSSSPTGTQRVVLQQETLHYIDGADVRSAAWGSGFATTEPQ